MDCLFPKVFSRQTASRIYNTHLIYSLNLHKTNPISPRDDRVNPLLNSTILQEIAENALDFEPRDERREYPDEAEGRAVGTSTSAFRSRIALRF